MSAMRTLRCSCGQVEMEVRGEPIVAGACHCGDCTEGSRRIEALPGAPLVLDDRGGTPYVLVRRDRLRVVRGGERLTEMRLRPGSRTRRVVASCCNSAMYVDVAPAHWLTTYRARWEPDAPPVTMRLSTRDADLAGDPLTRGPAAMARLAVRLVAAWVPMLVSRPTRRADGTAG